MNTKEVIQTHGVSQFAVRAWRRGYYIRTINKVTSKYWLFEDHSKLEAVFNKEQNNGRGGWEYNPIKVAVWIKKIQNNNSMI